MAGPFADSDEGREELADFVTLANFCEEALIYSSHVAGFSAQAHTWSRPLGFGRQSRCKAGNG
jgi:hypothetical protein